MNCLLSLFLLLSSTGFATEDRIVVLEVKLSIDGRLVSQPKILSVSGETATIESKCEEGNGIFIEVTPTVQGENQVHMSFVIAQVYNGTKTVLSEPRIVSLLGHSAELTQGSKDNSQQTMSLAVTPTLKN